MVSISEEQFTQAHVVGMYHHRSQRVKCSVRCSARHIKTHRGSTPYGNVAFTRTQSGDRNWGGQSTNVRTLFSRRDLRSGFCPSHAMDRSNIRGG